jgi:subtilisin family serine protease
MNRKILTTLFILILTLSITVSALGEAPAAPAAQGSADSYIVLMANDPVIAYEGDIPGYQATKPGRGQKINPNSAHVRKYADLLVDKQDRALRSAGVSTAAKVNEYTIALNGFSALLTEGQVEEIRMQKDVLMVMPDELLQVQTDSSPSFLGLDAPAGPYLRGVTGENVVVGIIDTGIWPEHPSFADDGSYGPPPVGPLPCEFGDMAHNPDDAPFTCNNKLLGAYQMLQTYRAVFGADPDEFNSARDDNGHGSHTASTTAGNAGVQATVLGIPRGTISGIAPRARVIAYKGCGNLGCFSSDTARAIDQAVADGVDVINYSIGGGPGAPGAADIAFLFAADAGLFVATSAGNSGPGSGTVGNPGTMPWLTTVGANTQSRFFQGTIELGDGRQFTGASITAGVDSALLVDAATAGGDLCVPGTLNPAMVSGKIVLCRRGAIARADKSRAVMLAGGIGMIMYENEDTNNLFSDSHWVPSVHIDQTPGLAIKSYIATTPGASASLVGEQISTWPYAPSMTIFSSRGPNAAAPDILKPDITAPGLQILAGYSPTPDPASTPPGELFAAIAGTSMSSPHIAGVFALLKQAHPDWSPAAAKSAMMTTAYQDVLDNDRVTQASPFAQGAGHVNAGGKANKGSLFEPGLVYDAGFLDYLGFLCDAFPSVFANPAATCAALESAGIPTKAYNLNYPSIAVSEVPGIQTIRRTVTSVAKESGNRTYTASVEAPPGYAVSVSPATLSLRKGESATFEVTFTNTGAPIGEWRFGSLTWSDATGNYAVRSPIAVKAALFSAPAEITGSGESGSASFDVVFGYTGSYAAAGHGLEPATVTSDNVLQDPDQSFSPGDVATGGANLHQFNLSGAALFRIAMPPEATEPNADLDIFVYNPNNVLVASSTSPGTDELVNIVAPMDGTWSVYVHGWSAPGGDSDYDMYTWAISATPGGNLAIDSAPSSATLGSVGTVSVSWSGATVGQWHLGAVSHTGDVGLMGLTLVNVDNR